MRLFVRNIVLMAALLAMPAPAPTQSVKAGVEAWQRADYAAAVGIWLPLAEADDADAAFNLGQAYRLGRGVRTDLAEAQTWYERAARKGHVDAQATLGLLLFDTGNRVGGLRWLKSAALSGEPRALLIYGTALFNGEGIPRDPILAYAYVSRAAAQGFAPAKTTLAQMDQILPLEQRKKGVALALTQAKPVKTAPAKATSIKAARLAVAKTKAPPKAPTATPAKAPDATPAGTGPWRVQLGAFSKRASAEALFERLSGSAALAGRRSFLIDAGAVTRLQAGPFESRAVAAAACARLAPQPCFPVATK